MPQQQYMPKNLIATPHALLMSLNIFDFSSGVVARATQMGLEHQYFEEQSLS
jgi:hypothetical protein